VIRAKNRIEEEEEERPCTC